MDINLTGVWHTAKAAIPHLRAGGNGGSMILTSSGAGMKASQNIGHYVAAKTGVIGLMRTLALELAPDMIRVNSLHPSTVATDMVLNEPHVPSVPAGSGKPAKGRCYGSVRCHQSPARRVA